MTGVSALADNTSKDLLVTSLKRRFVEARKQKPSRNVHPKVLHQAIDPFIGAPCPAVMAGGVATDDLPLASKVLTSRDVRSLPPTKNLASSSKPSPSSPISKASVPRGSSVPVLTGRKIKAFSEKFRETVQRPSCTKYDFR